MSAPTCTTYGGAIFPPWPTNPQQAQQPQHHSLFKAIMLRLTNLKPQHHRLSGNMPPARMLRLLRVMLRLVADLAIQERPINWALLRLLRLLRLWRVTGESPA